MLIPLSVAHGSPAPLIGGKAAGLGALHAAGFPVPAGLCVTTDAFRLALQPYQPQLDAILRRPGPQHPATATHIAELLRDLTVPAQVLAELALGLTILGNEAARYAVRSSATAEDRADASFAGQYLTVLGVWGLAAIQAAIVACWRSFFSANALAAQAQQGSLASDEAMAVLIQPLIDAECAGVCFSVDPVQQHRDLIVVEAAWGLGAGVVDGAVPVDTAWVRRNGFAVERRQVVEKTRRMAINPAGELQVETVPTERARAACLPEPWLQRIAQFAVAAEVALGRPQDIEWAIADQQVWILQSRPLTALAAEMIRPSFPVDWTDEAERRAFWQREELPVSPHKPPLPLEMESYLAAESTRIDTCRWMGAERNQTVKVVNGYTYTCAIPVGLPSADMRIRRTAWHDLYDRLADQGWSAWDLWGPEIIKATARLREFKTQAVDGLAIARYLEESLAAYRRHRMLHPFCDFHPRSAYYRAYAALTGQVEQAVKDEADQLLVGDKNPLTQLIDRLYDLAQLANRSPVVAGLMRQAPADLLAQLIRLPEAADLLQQLDEFLIRFGERNGDGWGSEASLGTVTWRDTPERVLQLAVQYLGAGGESPAVMRARFKAGRDAQVEALCAACADPETVAEFRRQWVVAQRTINVLEEHNHYIDQLSIGQLRHAVLAAAEWLSANASLPTQDDVFWLHFDEILAALQGSRPATLQTTLVERKASHAQWAALEPPPVLGVPPVALPPRPPWVNEVTEEPTLAPPGQVTGQAASPGVVQGRARVLHGLPPLPDLAPGDILVAVNAGPLWTPIFPLLGGLVLEEGSITQHAATTAREYGVPAVIGAREATRRIPDGAWITVDGATGIVKL